MRFSVHVQPGARVPRVAGTKAGSLSVRVRERAVEGAANDAVISAVAAALNLKPRSVRIVHGRRSRHKLLEVSGVDEEASALTLAQLRSSV